MLSVIEHIRSDNSKNFKVEALKEHAGNQLFRDIVLRTYSPLIRFGISLAQIPEYTPVSDESCKGLEWALTEIDKLSSREITGNAAKSHVGDVLSNLSQDNAEVICLMLDGSLKLGCNVSSINKAWGKGTVPDTPYMGAVSYNSKKVERLFDKHECVSQQKADGRYTNIAIVGGNVSMESRQGLPTFFGDTFSCCTLFEDIYGQGIVLNGELLISGMEKDRYTSNGIIASLVSIGDKVSNGEDVSKEFTKFEKRWNMSYESALDLLKVELWDFIPMNIYTGADKWDMPYRERMNQLVEMIDALNDERVSFIESRLVANEAEAKRHFVEMLEAGNEGTILKSLDAGWSDGKPTTQVKYKNEIQLDLVITGANLGTGKNSNVYSSLNTQSSCGQLKTSPGGMNESLMQHVTDNLDDLIGKVVTVKCNGISTNKQGEYSALHPAVEMVRDDKEQADSLEQCIAIHEAALSLGDIGQATPPPQSNAEYKQTSLL